MNSSCPLCVLNVLCVKKLHHRGKEESQSHQSYCNETFVNFVFSLWALCQKALPQRYRNVVFVSFVCTQSPLRQKASPQSRGGIAEFTEWFYKLPLLTLLVDFVSSLCTLCQKCLPRSNGWIAEASEISSCSLRVLCVYLMSFVLKSFTTEGRRNHRVIRVIVMNSSCPLCVLRVLCVKKLYHRGKE